MRQTSRVAASRTGSDPAPPARTGCRNTFLSPVQRRSMEITMTETQADTRKEDEGTAVEAGSKATERFTASGKLAHAGCAEGKGEPAGRGTHQGRQRHRRRTRGHLRGIQRTQSLADQGGNRRGMAAVPRRVAGAHRGGRQLPGPPRHRGHHRGTLLRAGLPGAPDPGHRGDARGRGGHPAALQRPLHRYRRQPHPERPGGDLARGQRRFLLPVRPGPARLALPRPRSRQTTTAASKSTRCARRRTRFPRTGPAGS